MQRFLYTYGPTWLVQFLLMVALWFAFVAKTELAEALIGIGAAALAATADAAVRRSRIAKFRPKPAWLLEAWRLPGDILRDTILVFKALLRQLILHKKPQNILRSIPFDSGGHSARSSARRALALFFTTISPNFIVIGIDNDKNSMLIHQVEPSEVSEVTKRLGHK
ncbi:MAG TPA: hypothetical protein VKY31_07100 [Terriglobia bacterium]|jgi:hypothetical protein|nr:hypothetical protein [Terriglobia bacterium]